MKKQERDDLRDHLMQWDVQLERDPATSRHVLNRIAADRVHREPWARPPSVVTYLLVAGIAAIVTLGVVFISGERTRARLLQDNQYQLIIDPVTRADLHRDDVYEDRLLEQLAWMQSRLDLSREQFMQLVDLHRNYTDTFNGLYQELVSLEAEYEHFEVLRKNDQMVDFIALYDVLNSRKQAENQAHDLSRELISRVSAILTPSQKTAYLSLIKPDLKPNA